MKWAVLISIGTVFFCYSVLAAFLWGSEWWVKHSGESLSPLVAHSKEPHQILPLDEGLASLSARLDLIKSATRTIELEFFIYELDSASEIITQALIEASKRGVNVRLLVDFSAPVFKLKPAYAALLNQYGIQVKYYNTVGLIRFVSAQHRSHRKLLIVDQSACITGGRNIGNEYFDLSATYNFLDSDILIRGPLVTKIQESFDAYWNSSIASNPQPTEEEIQKSRTLKFASFERHLKEQHERLNDFRRTRNSKSDELKCNDISFISDSPGIFLSNRQVFTHLEKFLAEAKTELIAESPYFILRQDGLNLIKNLSQRKIKQTILTNSLFSTDAFYTVSGLFFSLKPLQETNLELFAFSGESQKSVNAEPKRWGIHSKRAVIDGKHVLIGTYNIDPRSANLNSELMILCRNSPELAHSMARSITERIQDSKPVLTRQVLNFSNLMGNADFQQKALFLLALPLSRLFSFLL